MCHRVTIKEVPPITPTDVIKVLESAFKDTSENATVMSQEDIIVERITRRHQNEQGWPFGNAPSLQAETLPS